MDESRNLLESDDPSESDDLPIALIDHGDADDIDVNEVADDLRNQGYEVEIIDSSDIINLPAEKPYQIPENYDDPNRPKVSVHVPDSYAPTTYVDTYEPSYRTTIELSTTRIDMSAAGFLVNIMVDDAGFFDWASEGSAVEYVKQAKGDRFNSSWEVEVDGHAGTVLVTGSLASGGETGGCVYLFLDEATIRISIVPLDDEMPKADEFSKFLHSQEFNNLLSQITISIA